MEVKWALELQCRRGCGIEANHRKHVPKRWTSEEEDHLRLEEDKRRGDIHTYMIIADRTTQSRAQDGIRYGIALYITNRRKKVGLASRRYQR